MFERWLGRRRSAPQAFAPEEPLISTDVAPPQQAASPLALMSVPELVTEFASLGDNCEFGIVQRYCDAEPLDYFRFAWTPRHLLQEAVDNGFEGIGEPDDLELHVTSIDEYVCRSRRYGSFDYHTEVFRGQEPEETVRSREVRKTAFLRRRLLSDLGACEKIFVRKGEDSREFADMRALADGLRHTAPNVLLWVVQADAEHPAGSVEDLGEGLIRGRLAAFAPTDSAFLMDVEGWLKLCRNALELTRRLRGQEPPPCLATAELLTTGRDWSVHHGQLDVTASSIPAVRGYSLQSGDGALMSCHPGFTPDPGDRLVFSTWIRTEQASGLKGLFCNFRNDAKTNFRIRLGAVEPGHWTRVWASSLMPKTDADPTVHLQLDGVEGARFELADWRFERGHAPASVAPQA